LENSNANQINPPSFRKIPYTTNITRAS